MYVYYKGRVKLHFTYKCKMSTVVKIDPNIIIISESFYKRTDAVLEYRTV